MKKALMVWGGWEGHEPQKCVERFAPFLRANGFEVEISDTLDAYLDAENERAQLGRPGVDDGHHHRPAAKGAHRRGA